MCDFIMAILPGNVDLPAVGAVFERHKVGFRQIHNPFVSAQVAPGDIWILTTRGGCDCGTPLGSLAYKSARETDHFEAQTAKLRKQGWSEAKIQRWRTQKDSGRDKQEREDKTRAETSVQHVEPWLLFLTDLLASKLTDRIGLMVHWYRRDFETERLKIEKQELVSPDQRTIDQLLHLQDGIVYHYVR